MALTHDDRPGPPSPDVPSTDGPANPIAISDVTALQVSVEWTEAVAIVEALCVLLVREDPVSVWVPDAQDVLITAHGTVMIRRGARGTQNIDELARMLHALLDPASTPMPLRLFITQSIGSDRFESARAFADALAYYGRPGRPALIGALYQRCLETPVAAVWPIRPPVSPPSSPGAARGRVRRLVPLAVAAILIVTAPVAWLWRSSGTPSAPVTTVRDAVAAAAVTAARSVGLENRTPAGASRPAAPLARPADAATARAARPADTRDEGLDPARTEDVILPLPDMPVSALELLEPAVVFDTDAAPLLEDALSFPGAVAGDDSTIYSSAHPEVQPPVMYYPQLPPVPQPPPGASGTNTMDLVIDETGRVLGVRLTSRPIRMPDMMLLSGAKTWKFHPALKDGQPVKYRLSLSWIVAPP